MNVRSSASAIAAERLGRLRLPLGRGRRVAGDMVRAGHRLVGGRQVPVVAVRVRLGQLHAAPRVPERRLGATQDRVDAGALPLAAGEVHVVADLAPVVARGVGRVDHLVVLGGGPRVHLEQRPGVVEQAGGQCPPGRLVEFRWAGRLRHDGLLPFGHARHVVEDALESVAPRLDPCAVGVESPRPLGRVVRGEDVADLLERDLELAKAGDRPRILELARPVASIAAGCVDLGGPQQVELVVVPERPDAQPGEPGEPSDGQQLVHGGIVDPRVTRESSPRGARSPVRRCRARGRWRAG